MLKDLKVIDNSTVITGSYDEEADVLYLTFGEPTSAIAQDISSNTIVRIDEKDNRVAGITITGFYQQLLKDKPD